MFQQHDSVGTFLRKTLFSVSKQLGGEQPFLAGRKVQRWSRNSLCCIEPNISDETIPQLCTLFFKDNSHVRLDIPRGLSNSDCSTKPCMS